MEFGRSGRVFDKQAIIDALRGEATPSQRLVLDFKTSVLAPGVVLATYRLTRSDSDGEVRAHSLRSSIWKLELRDAAGGGHKACSAIERTSAHRG